MRWIKAVTAVALVAAATTAATTNAQYTSSNDNDLSSIDRQISQLQQTVQQLHQQKAAAQSQPSQQSYNGGNGNSGSSNVSPNQLNGIESSLNDQHNLLKALTATLSKPPTAGQSQSGPNINDVLAKLEEQKGLLQSIKDQLANQPQQQQYNSQPQSYTPAPATNLGVADGVRAGLGSAVNKAKQAKNTVQQKAANAVNAVPSVSDITNKLPETPSVSLPSVSLPSAPTLPQSTRYNDAHALLTSVGKDRGLAHGTASTIAHLLLLGFLSVLLLTPLILALAFLNSCRRSTTQNQWNPRSKNDWNQVLQPQQPQYEQYQQKSPPALPRQPAPSKLSPSPRPQQQYDDTQQPQRDYRPSPRNNQVSNLASNPNGMGYIRVRKGEPYVSEERANVDSETSNDERRHYDSFLPDALTNRRRGNQQGQTPY